MESVETVKGRCIESKGSPRGQISSDVKHLNIFREIDSKEESEPATLTLSSVGESTRSATVLVNESGNVSSSVSYINEGTEDRIAYK